MLDVLIAGAEGAQDGGSSGGGQWWTTAVFFGLLLVVFYLLMIRPQQKQRREQQAMINSIRRGDKVVTVGGIHGRIEGIKDDTVSLKIAEGVKIEISKASVARVKERKDEEETKLQDEE
jgi:preprotein translocase subunit YajC